MNNEQERAEFEAWFQYERGQPARKGDGTYSPFASGCWRAWQARAALQSHTPNVEFEDPRVQLVYGIICGGHEPPEGEHWDGYVSRLIVDALQSQDREDAERYRWLLAKLQQAYDGECFESECLSIYCRMSSQFKGDRTIQAEITWRDKTDEPLGLSEAIDHARRVEENK